MRCKFSQYKAMPLKSICKHANYFIFPSFYDRKTLSTSFGKVLYFTMSLIFLFLFICILFNGIFSLSFSFYLSFPFLFTSFPFMHIYLMNIKQFILLPIYWINKIITTSNFPLICTINFIIKNWSKLGIMNYRSVKFEHLSLKLWSWYDWCLAPS